MEQEKLIHSASVIDRILKILQGFLIAGAAVAAIFIPLLAIFGEKMIASASTLKLGVLRLELSGEMVNYLDMDGIKRSLIVVMISAVVICACLWYILRVLRQTLEPMKSGRPFESGISRKIRKLGWTVMIAGLIAELAGTAASVFELRAYDLPLLLNRELVSSYGYDFSISLWPAVAGALLLFFLSYLFRCGEVLQQESDETL